MPTLDAHFGDMDDMRSENEYSISGTVDNFESDQAIDDMWSVSLNQARFARPDAGGPLIRVTGMALITGHDGPRGHLHWDHHW